MGDDLRCWHCPTPQSAGGDDCVAGHVGLKTSGKIIPLKGRADFLDSSQIPATETIRVWAASPGIRSSGLVPARNQTAGRHHGESCGEACAGLRRRHCSTPHSAGGDDCVAALGQLAKKYKLSTNTIQKIKNGEWFGQKVIKIRFSGPK